MTKNAQIFHKLLHCDMFRHYRVILRELVINTLPSYTSIFCTMTNKCTNISQIITLLHVSTLSCHPQGACNQYLAKLHKYILYYDQQMQIISQIITLLHVSTLSCYPQTACNQYLAKLHKYILYYDQQMHNYFTNYHTATCFDTVMSSSDSL